MKGAALAVIAGLFVAGLAVALPQQPLQTLGPSGGSSSGSSISTNPLDAGSIFTPGIITGQDLFLLRPTATNEAARCYPASVGVDGNCIFDFYEQSDISNTAHVWMGMVGVDGWVTLGFEGAVIASTKAGSGTTKDLHITAADGSNADRLQAADLAMTIYAADQTVLARKKFEVNGATYMRAAQTGALDAGSFYTPGNATVGGTLRMQTYPAYDSETLTPFSGGGQASATQITKPLAFGTPAAAGDSVKLPASPVAGTTVVVCNMSTTVNRYIAVYGPSGTSVNGTVDGSKLLQNQTCGDFFAASSTSWWGGN